MSGYVLLAVGAAAAAAALAFITFRAARVWHDAGSRGLSAPQRIGRTLEGALVPSRYWWGARIDALPAGEQRELLVHQAAALGLSQADSQRCPLCGAEIPHAWTLTASGQADVALGPVHCPACDFRLDACRHCDHFLPGPPRAWLSTGFGAGDITFGRCGIYKRVQPVEQAAAPEMARQLRARGYERISAPMPIADSMGRPDSCRAFKPNRTRIGASQIRWPGARRTALLRLMKSEAASRGQRPEASSGQGQA